MRRIVSAIVAGLITQAAASAPSLSHQSLAFQSDAAGGIPTDLYVQTARDVPVVGFAGAQERFLPTTMLGSSLNGPLALDVRLNAVTPLVVDGGRRAVALGSQFSANGRYQTVLAFDPIHPNGGGERDGLYLIDRQTGTFWLVNHLPGQPQVIANGFTSGERVSDDGERVYFSYEGNDLAPAQVDRRHRLVYAFERASGTIRLASPVPLGLATNRDVSVIWISADGSEAIYAEGTSVFHYDWETNASRPLPSPDPASSARLVDRSGQFLFTCATMYRPGAAQVDSVWTRTDLRTGAERVLNPASGGSPSTESCRSFGQASADGSVFAFTTSLPPTSGIPDLNNWQTYRWSASSGQTKLVSHAFNQPETFAQGQTTLSDLSADGQTLLLQSTAQNLLPGITGRRVNALYRYDAMRQSIQLVSATESAPTVPLESGVATLLSDGSAVFASDAELDETVRDWNLEGDLFRRTEAGAPTLLTRRVQNRAVSASRGVDRQDLSADGRWLALQSTSRDLVPGGHDLNEQADVILVDTWTGQRRLISTSRNQPGQAALGTSELIAMSADGQTVLFQSNASDLNADLPADGVALQTYVFRHGQIRAVNRRPAIQGGGLGDAATPLAVSADGSLVLVQSPLPETLLEGYQPNLSAPARQLLLLSTTGAAARLVSRSAVSARIGADQDVQLVAASNSLRYVLFRSEAQNLDRAATGNDANAYYLADTEAGSVRRLGRVGDLSVLEEPDYVLPSAFFSTDERQLLLTHTDPDFATPNEIGGVTADCFRYDLRAGTWQRLTGAGLTVSADQYCRAASADGEQILLDRDWVPTPFAPVRRQTWWRDTRNGNERLLSQPTTTQSFGVNRASYGLALSADGTAALLSTRASNLVAGAGRFNEPNLYRVVTSTGAVAWINQPATDAAPDIFAPQAHVRASSDLSAIAFLDYNSRLVADVVDTASAQDSFLYRTEASPNNPGLTGLWTSANDPSQGFHFVAMPERGQWLASWYTYRTEQGLGTRTDQRWLIGLGTVSGQQIEFVMNTTQDGVFNAGTTTIPEPVGRLQIQLDSCRAAHATYTLTLDGQTVSGNMALNRISSDAVCTAFKRGGQPAIEATDNMNGLLRIGHTGAWHDPRNPGQGLIIEVLPDTGQVLASWFTFDPASPQANGKQPPLWMLAQGTLGSSNQLRVFESRGGRFAAPTATVLSPVGSMTLTPTSCDTMVLQYGLNFGGTARAGTQALQRLTPGLPCLW